MEETAEDAVDIPVGTETAGGSEPSQAGARVPQDRDTSFVLELKKVRSHQVELWWCNDIDYLT